MQTGEKRMGPQKIILADLAATKKFAEGLAAQITTPTTIALVGPLGAGKTTFMSYFAAALGVAETITSPTYVLQHCYLFADKQLEHWDVYRCSSLPEELFEDCAVSSIRVVEWADKFPEFLENCEVKLEFVLEYNEKGEIERWVRGF